MPFRPEKCLIPSILKDRRMTARDLSELTGISETAISDYGSKRKVMVLSTAKTIAEALYIPIDDLYEWKLVEPKKKKGRQLTE